MMDLVEYAMTLDTLDIGCNTGFFLTLAAETWDPRRKILLIWGWLNKSSETFIIRAEFGRFIFPKHMQEFYKLLFLNKPGMHLNNSTAFWNSCKLLLYQYVLHEVLSVQNVPYKIVSFTD